MGKIQPFLRWAGSKRQLLPALSKYWDAKFTRYVEPFAGSASLFFSLSPSQALLGDINAELMATYQQLRENLPSLLEALRTMRKGRKNYLRLRALNPSELSPQLRAARFIYLNRFCFNGLYRTNRAGQFNVPYGDDKKFSDIPSDDLFAQCSSALQKARFITGSFEKTLARTRPGDFVYMDPPFSVKGRRVFNEYDATVFGSENLRLLRQWMVELDRNNIHFVVSYAESEEAEFLRDGFYAEVVEVRRNIAGFVKSRKRAYELLISNQLDKKQ